MITVTLSCISGGRGEGVDRVKRITTGGISHGRRGCNGLNLREALHQNTLTPQDRPVGSVQLNSQRLRSLTQTS
jgi:hypothetical protein